MALSGVWFEFLDWGNIIGMDLKGEKLCNAQCFFSLVFLLVYLCDQHDFTKVGDI